MRAPPGCPVGVELLETANRQRSPSWFTAWRTIEAEAVRLRTAEPSLVPGLLQTEDYARAVLTGMGVHSPELVEQYLAGRLDRQELLTGPEPKQFTAIVDEVALRRVVGGRTVHLAQLEHLAAMVARPHIRLHVMPSTVGVHPGLAGGFVLATLAGGDQVVYSDGVFGQVVDRPESVGMVHRCGTFSSATRWPSRRPGSSSRSWWVSCER